VARRRAATGGGPRSREDGDGRRAGTGAAATGGGPGDIGIPNGPVEEGTRGFVEGPWLEEYEARKPN
jgi:hypothetical protein